MSTLAQDLSAREIAAHLHRGRKSGAGYVACCPSHPDDNPSLSLRDGDGGTVLVHCFSGCPQQDVIDALRSKGLWPERERRWLTPWEWQEQQRYRAEMRERERHAGYFCLALEPLLIETIEKLPPVETVPLEWPDDIDPERLILTKELAMVRAAREHSALQVALFAEWMDDTPIMTEAICAAGIERKKRIQMRIWGWVNAQR